MRSSLVVRGLLHLVGVLIGLAAGSMGCAWIWSDQNPNSTQTPTINQPPQSVEVTK